VKLAESVKDRSIIDANSLRDRLSLASNEIAKPELEAVDVPTHCDSRQISGSSHCMGFDYLTNARSGRSVWMRAELSRKVAALLLGHIEPTYAWFIFPTEMALLEL